MSYYEILRDFYNRQKKRFPKYQAKPDQLSLRVFPTGIQPWQASTPVTPPTDGEIILSDSPLLQKAGLHPGEVIVALDGMAIHNEEQYRWARSLSTDTHMELEVWSGIGYILVHVDLADRKFQCHMQSDYQGQ